MLEARAVLRFLAGFALASAICVAGVSYAVFELGWGPPEVEEPIEVAAVDEAPVADEPSPTRRSRRGRVRRGASGGSSGGTREGAGVASGSRADLEAEATTGDDLGEGGIRMIDGAGTGGEEQLTGAEIESAFDGVMGRVRRCFLLAPDDAPVSGRLTFGLRVAGTGRVSAVNLTGPSGLTAGECGQCLRDAARGMSFPSFDGPEMVVRYPITLE